MRIYVALQECGWGQSDYICGVSLDKEKLIQECKKEYHSATIKIYNSETMDLIEDCDTLIKYTDGHTCNCSECKSLQSIVTSGIPILVYDNKCISCTKYAKLAVKLMNNKVKAIGLYTEDSFQLRAKYPVLREVDWFEMSWFLINGKAHGGRAGLIRMLKYILFERNGLRQINQFKTEECNTDCMTIKGVWFRSMSILTREKKVFLID